MTELSTMRELTGAELDAVAGGQRGQGNANALGLGGLAGVGVAVGVGIGNVSVDIIDDVRVNIENLLNNNDVAIGVAANLLGTTVQSLRAG